MDGVNITLLSAQPSQIVLVGYYKPFASILEKIIHHNSCKLTITEPPLSCAITISR